MRSRKSRDSGAGMTSPPTHQNRLSRISILDSAQHKSALDEIANSDNQPRSRARLFDLADRYRRLADRLRQRVADDEPIANSSGSFRNQG